MPKPRHAVAVDAGGTTTRAVVVDASGTCLSEAHGPTGNPRVVGADRAAATIAATCRDAVDQADAQPELFVVTAAGLLSLGGEFAELHAALSAAGLEGLVRLEPDLLGAWFSATTEQTGSVLIVGTGTTAARIEHAEVTVTRDGLGWLLGDGGGGFWIGHQAARAAARHLDHRGPATSLTDGVVAMADRLPSVAPGRDPRLAGLVDWAYSASPVRLAALAPLVMREAERGDEVARTICEQAAERILAAVAALPGGTGLPVAVGGGIVGADGPVGRVVMAELGPAAVRVTDGVTGAALMAVGMLGGTTDDATRLRITASLDLVRG